MRGLAGLLATGGAPSVADGAGGIAGFLLGSSLVFVLLVAAVAAFFLVRYRARAGAAAAPGPETDFGIARGVVILLAFAFVAFVFQWSVRVEAAMRRPPVAPLEIEVVGSQWLWQFQHPEGRREINELHVPVRTPVRFTMTSQDLLHGMSIPAFRLQRDVFPGRTTTLWFEAPETGDFPFFCSKYCGTNHARMAGTLHVVDAGQYEDWLSGGARNQTPEEAGKALFRSFRCDSCHNNGPKHSAPDLAGLFGTPVKLADGTSVAFDAAYVRESILDPAAKTVANYTVAMQSYKGQLNEEQIGQITAYLKSLQK